jgi:hypothetical protein
VHQFFKILPDLRKRAISKWRSTKMAFHDALARAGSVPWKRQSFCPLLETYRDGDADSDSA